MQNSEKKCVSARNSVMQNFVNSGCSLTRPLSALRDAGEFSNGVSSSYKVCDWSSGERWENKKKESDFPGAEQVFKSLTSYYRKPLDLRCKWNTCVSLLCHFLFWIQTVIAVFLCVCVLVNVQRIWDKAFKAVSKCCLCACAFCCGSTSYCAC